jgi:sporulation protein YqfC
MMHSRLRELREITQIANTPMPGVPLVEVLGDKRALIENHCGVVAYESNLICIRVHCGKIEIHGSGLTLMRMTDSQMVINGKIDSVEFCYTARG